MKKEESNKKSTLDRNDSNNEFDEAPNYPEIEEIFMDADCEIKKIPPPRKRDGKIVTPKYGFRKFGMMDLPTVVEPNFGVDYLKAEKISEK